MDGDIREKMNWHIDYYRKEIKTLWSIEEIHNSAPDQGSGMLGINSEYDYLRGMWNYDREHFENRRRIEIQKLENKIEQARKDAEEKQRRRDIDRAQSEHYDKWKSR